MSKTKDVSCYNIKGYSNISKGEPQVRIQNPLIWHSPSFSEPVLKSTNMAHPEFFWKSFVFENEKSKMSFYKSLYLRKLQINYFKKLLAFLKFIGYTYIERAGELK